MRDPQATAEWQAHEADHDADFGLARMYSVFREQEEATARVFRDQESAMAWLAPDR